ncbi:DnaD domain protein [Priestia flexa]|uniref:DnaD domain-containing protein n=1 Tax=Priestia flexa TaxID=86664 RepID=UPI003D2ABCE9
MDFKHEVFSIISELTGQNNVITLNVAFVDFTGDLESGLFLSQVIYWADRAKRTDGFFYKTDDEWNDEIKLTKYGVRKSRKKLEELGILETKVKKANGNPTVHYKLDKKRFVELFISFLRNRKNQIANTKEGSFENEISLTDTTTDIYTDINSTTTKANVFQFYEQNFGQISPYLSEEIGYWLKDFNEQHDIIIEAFKIAVERNKRTWGYTKAILKDWYDRGAKSLNDVHALQNESKPKVNIGTHTKQNGGYLNERTQQNNGNVDTSEYDDLSL